MSITSFMHAYISARMTTAYKHTYTGDSGIKESWNSLNSKSSINKRLLQDFHGVF